MYGDFDTMIPPADQDMPCEWVMVTDRRQECPPWQVVVEPRPRLRPSFAGKVARARPDLYSDADILIWADGNLQIHSSSFVSWCVAKLGEAPLAAKDTRTEGAGMRDEANVAATMGKCEGQPVQKQAEHYIADGFPDDLGQIPSTPGSAAATVIEQGSKIQPPRRGQYSPAAARLGLGWAMRQRLTSKPRAPSRPGHDQRAVKARAALPRTRPGEPRASMRACSYHASPGPG